MKKFIIDNLKWLSISSVIVVAAFAAAISYRGFTLIGGETCLLAAYIVFWRLQWDKRNGVVKW